MPGVGLALKGIPHKKPGLLPAGKIWPSGEFSCGWVKTRADERLDGRFAEYCPPGWSQKPGEVCPTPGPPAPLDLSNLPNSHRAPNRPESYGRKGMTSYGRKMVRSAGALIDRFYPSHRVTFATVTMPVLPQPLRRELGRLWPILVNRLVQWLTRRLKRAGLPRVVVSVSEVQPGRYAQYSEAYLHLHLMWLNHPGKAGNWAIDVLNLRSWISDFLQSRGVWSNDSYVNVDVRSVKGSKAAYLSKYASKGTEEIHSLAEDCGWEAVPGQWWNMTATCRAWVKDHTTTGRACGAWLHYLVDHAFDSGDFSDFRWLYHVEVEMGKAQVTVGWRGCFDVQPYQHILRMIADGALAS